MRLDVKVLTIDEKELLLKNSLKSFDNSCKAFEERLLESLSLFENIFTGTELQVFKDYFENLKTFIEYPYLRYDMLEKMKIIFDYHLKIKKDLPQVKFKIISSLLIDLIFNVLFDFDYYIKQKREMALVE